MYSSPTCVNLPRHVNFREREREGERGEGKEEEDASQQKKLNGKEGSVGWEGKENASWREVSVVIIRRRRCCHAGAVQGSM